MCGDIVYTIIDVCVTAIVMTHSLTFFCTFGSDRAHVCVRYRRPQNLCTDFDKSGSRSSNWDRKN